MQGLNLERGSVDALGWAKSGTRSLLPWQSQTKSFLSWEDSLRQRQKPRRASGHSSAARGWRTQGRRALAPTAGLLAARSCCVPALAKPKWVWVKLCSPPGPLEIWGNLEISLPFPGNIPSRHLLKQQRGLVYQWSALRLKSGMLRREIWVNSSILSNGWGRQINLKPDSPADTGLKG